jgi:hypothetical protein
MRGIVIFFGIVLILVGLLGFIDNPVFGIFAVDSLHNFLHLISGILALIFAGQGRDSAAVYGKIFGVVYGALAVAGFLTPGDSLLGIMASNTADDILHAVLAVFFLIVGFIG